MDVKHLSLRDSCLVLIKGCLLIGLLLKFGLSSVEA